MLTSLAPDSTSRDSFGIDVRSCPSATPAQPLEPLAKDCPDDLPCRVADADLWFAETPALLEQAKSLCASCPARLACLAGALERREPWGVWGGEIFERGSIIARKRPRGRPRKDDAGRADEVAA